MTVRKTTTADLPAVMRIFEEARQFMRETGNGEQWPDGKPSQEQLEEDIKKGGSYVCVNDSGEIAATFYFNEETDPTYAEIDGAWQNDAPYAVVHRVARSQTTAGTRGAGAFCLEWCLARHANVRIDTHKDNAPMLRLLERLGFVCCGIIWLTPEKLEERLAYQFSAAGGAAHLR